ncbi:MAG: phosphoribosylformylglycinamidine synthase subunit PurS [Alphaproteobacteria bacterium]|jgi:phosphoribosylformylglycinamidine synthase PurS subunit
MLAKIFVSLKDGVLDPQGRAIHNTLNNLGFTNLEKISQGKYFEIKLKATSKDKAEKEIDEICKKLLVNEIIEKYRFEIIN